MQNRLDVILETVDQILEGAKRTKERATFRNQQAATIVGALAKNIQPKNPIEGAAFARMLQGIIRHSPTRLEKSKMLKSARSFGEHGRAAAQGMLNLASGRDEFEPGDKYA